MAHYITYGEFQQQMKDYYLRSGSRMQFNEMISYLFRKGLLLDAPPAIMPREWDDQTSDQDFNKIIDALILSFSPNHPSYKVGEADIIPPNRDVFIIRHPRYTKPSPHSHNYFEINYVVQGSCTFIFKNDTRTMGEGEFCIIAPSSKHDIVIDDESTVFCIMLRKSTFDTTFFSLLSGTDLLSYFFRTILQDDAHDNFLLFFTQNNRTITNMIRHALCECHRADDYSNICCISWINLMFSELLRNYSKTLQFYNYQMGSDFSLVLQYIKHNYQTITLSSLAELFHYSEPHLCKLIKQNTGFTFSELVKRLRISNAVDYLTKTNLKVSEIAEQIGYNSADHFSRIFRSVYHISPQEYRKKIQTENQSAFHPFEFQ